MITGHVVGSLKLPETALVLDLCAAPGGKSTHLLSILGRGSLLISNEVIRSRAVILQENIQKWGCPNVVVTQNDPEIFGQMGDIFDLIMVDAPCSGEGLFRKDRSAISEWSENTLLHCAARQKRILTQAWQCLKPGGFLVYSTCTFNPAENQDNIEWLADRTGAGFHEINIKPEWNIQEVSTAKGRGYQFYPHQLKGEGFFLAVLSKPGQSESRGQGKIFPKNWVPASPGISSILESWVHPDFQGTFLTSGNGYYYFPLFWLHLLSKIEKNLNILQPGTPVATIKGDHFIPHPAFAHSVLLNHSSFRIIRVELSEALRFLKKETFTAAAGPAGWLGVAYRDVLLGWLKNLGTRTNNYYPPERRIRMQISDIALPWHEM
jgi:NOL1/NOP2/fmu family ribosome biogenesis protein/precorrin-6B methylase 2